MSDIRAHALSNLFYPPRHHNMASNNVLRLMPHWSDNLCAGGVLRNTRAGRRTVLCSVEACWSPGVYSIVSCLTRPFARHIGCEASDSSGVLVSGD